MYPSKPNTHSIIGCVPSEIFGALKTKTLELTKEDWNSWKDRQFFIDQKDSLTIPLINLPDKENPVFKKEIKNNALIDRFSNELDLIFKLIEKKYPDGEPKRLMFVSLPANKDVLKHIDGGHHLVNVRRIHVPIKTNDGVDFFVTGEKIPMQEGNIVEINNNAYHWVNNKSNEDRIHLMIDWGKKMDPYYNVQG